MQADGQQLILHSVGRTEQRSKNNGGYHVQNRAWIGAVSVYCDTYVKLFVTWVIYMLVHISLHVTCDQFAACYSGSFLFDFIWVHFCL